jgi:hypothetical protein
VMNLARVRYRSHSHGPSSESRKQCPRSSDVLKKFAFTHSIADDERAPQLGGCLPKDQR